MHLMTTSEIITCLIGIAIALALGFCIGFERKMRFKEAGTRTHTIVCVASALYTMISIYGFEGGDPARIAAQVVPGIGFIGAGMIFHHKQIIRGLTTAAGIWATAAVGMAVGSGMWIVAVCAAALIIIIQCIMHLPFKIFHSHKYVRLNVVFRCDNGEEKEIIKNLFKVERFYKIHAEKGADGIIFKTIINTDYPISDKDIHEALTSNDCIISISREDDEVS